jgi:hypothetical protein
MPPDLMFWIGVAIKMAITALFVSVATIVAEKLGSAVGALVATLPVSMCFWRSITTQLSFPQVHSRAWR